MKKVALIILISTCVNIIPLGTVKSYAQEEGNDYIAVEQLQEKDLSMEIDLGNYQATIKEIPGSNCEKKFEVTENGVKYILAIDSEHEKVTIDDNKVYSLEKYFEAVRKQVNYIENNKSKKSIENIDIKTILSEYPSERCISCNKYSPNYPPTSGYNSLKYTGTLSNRFEVGFTAAALAGCVSVLGPSGYAVTGAITTAQAKTIMSKLVSLGYAVGTEARMYYKKYQAYHPQCPKAVKEQRKYYYNSNCTDHARTNTSYFYSSKPY